jgi:alanine racemase
MEFAPQAHIDHGALRHNLKRVRQAAPECKIWAVIKADAYGHGMLRVAGSLAEADGLAVARLDEALELRRHGFQQRILILSACSTRAEFKAAAAAGLDTVIHHPHQLEELPEGEDLAAPLSVWLKVDTGMHRLGFDPRFLVEVSERLARNPVIGDLHLISHLACADDPADPLTGAQCRAFFSLDPSPYRARSLANSAGILGVPESHADWVRPGIMLYGASPLLDSRAEQMDLRPVMTLSSRVISVKQCRAGETVGYGGTYRCPEAMPVAVIAVGYGDGYPRHAPSGTPVRVRGQNLPLAGRVSMDMITVDARALPDIRIGDPAVLWGEGLPVEEIAQHAGTIAYELLCGVTRRVTFIDCNTGEAR